jgi:hypothetical protein
MLLIFSYEPVMSVQELHELRNETSLEHYKRCNQMIEKILERNPSKFPIIFQ